MKKKNPEREEKLRQFRRDYHRIALETFAPPSAGASPYEKIRYFLQVHLTPELTQHQIPQEYLDAWYVEDIDAYTDYIQRHDMEADNERTLPFRVFMEAQAGHDDYYSILRDEEDYRTPGSWVWRCRRCGRSTFFITRRCCARWNLTHCVWASSPKPSKKCATWRTISSPRVSTGIPKRNFAEKTDSITTAHPLYRPNERI